MEPSGSPKFIPPLSYNLVMLGVHGFLYGLFLVLSILSSIVLVLRHRRAKLEGSIWLHPLFVGGLALTTFVTIHWILSFVHGAEVTLKGTPTLYYFQGTPQAGGLLAMDWLCAFMCDFTMIYRLWTMYNGARAIVALPAVSVAGLLVTGPGIIYELVRLKPGETMYKPSFFKWIPADGALSMCTNMYCTIFISFRIWKASQPLAPGIRGVSSSLPKRIIPLLSQSAFLYTGISAAFYIAVFLKSPLQWPFLELWPVVAGISFVLLSSDIAMTWVANVADPRRVTSVNFRRGADTIELGALNEMLDSVTPTVEGNTGKEKTGIARISSNSTQV
ncbi:hypothetical protein DL96DRAFT_1713195 [Flagelloscypha sp. PMI_526]|nr:hypothetical protein DL96DRAFT_1713195 [Flagelloscypha sp. PMI_526]